MKSEQKKQKKIIPSGSIASRRRVKGEEKKQEKITPLGSIASRGDVSLVRPRCAADWRARRKLILSQPENLFGSIEDLQESQRQKKTSLGIIKPKEIIGFHIEKKTKAELAEEDQKKLQIIGQLSFVVEKKELDLMPYRFLISFACDNPDCTKHRISILDREFGQLYRKVLKSGDWEEKMREKVEQLCSKERDVFFFMGNMASRRNTFCILGMFYPPKTVGNQLDLFRS